MLKANMLVTTCSIFHTYTKFSGLVLQGFLVTWFLFAHKLSSYARHIHTSSIRDHNKERTINFRWHTNDNHNQHAPAPTNTHTCIDGKMPQNKRFQRQSHFLKCFRFLKTFFALYWKQKQQHLDQKHILSTTTTSWE